MTANRKQNQKPVRVLHVLGTTNLGGAESRIMEIIPLYRQKPGTVRFSDSYQRRRTL